MSKLLASRGDWYPIWQCWSISDLKEFCGPNLGIKVGTSCPSGSVEASSLASFGRNHITLPFLEALLLCNGDLGGTFVFRHVCLPRHASDMI